jgi:hypothetical protein
VKERGALARRTRKRALRICNVKSDNAKMYAALLERMPVHFIEQKHALARQNASSAIQAKGV